MNPIDILVLRKKLGLNQSEFAALFGVHSVTVSRWENGARTPTPEIEAAIKRKAAEIKRPYRPRKK